MIQGNHRDQEGMLCLEKRHDMIKCRRYGRRLIIVFQYADIYHYWIYIHKKNIVLGLYGIGHTNHRTTTSYDKVRMHEIYIDLPLEREKKKKRKRYQQINRFVDFLFF